MSDTIKATKSTLILAGKEFDCYMLPDGSKWMSQVSVGRSLKVSDSSVRDWVNGASDSLAVAGFEGKTPESPSGSSIAGRGNPGIMAISARGQASIVAFSPEAVLTFWGYKMRRGNTEAFALVMACAQETLERRLDAAFSEVKSEEHYEKQTELVYKTWRDARDFSKSVHPAFANFCKNNGINGAQVHDEITRRITGMSADQHRELELQGEDASIGLDHVPIHDDLARIAKAKLRFTTMTAGSLESRIERATKQTPITT